jgi:hypothetical protein
MRVFKPKSVFGTAKWILYAVVVALCVLLVYLGLEQLGQRQDAEHIHVAHDAVVRAVVQCYALESRYPDGLDYLEANYGLVLDEHFIYHYHVIGSNIMPEIQVISKTIGGTDG